MNYLLTFTHHLISQSLGNHSEGWKVGFIRKESQGNEWFEKNTTQLVNIKCKEFIFHIQ